MWRVRDIFEKFRRKMFGVQGLIQGKRGIILQEVHWETAGRRNEKALNDYDRICKWSRRNGRKKCGRSKKEKLTKWSSKNR